MSNSGHVKQSFLHSADTNDNLIVDKKVVSKLSLNKQAMNAFKLHPVKGSTSRRLDIEALLKWKSSFLGLC